MSTSETIADLTLEDETDQLAGCESSVDESTRPRGQRACGRPVREYLFFTVCAILYILPFTRVLLLGTDEGLLVYGAVRVVQGQVFARDFFEVVGPGTFYWVALFFRLFGVTFFAVRACLFVTSLGIALLSFALSRRVCVRYRALPCLVIGATSFGALWPTISHHVDSNCAALLCVFIITVWLDTDKPKLLWVGGIAAGVTACFHLPKGVLVFFALLLWLFAQRQRRPAWLRNAVHLTAGFAGVLGCVLLYFWSQHAAWDLLNATFIWPSQHYGGVNQVSYAHGIFGEYWDVWGFDASRLQWTMGLAALLIFPHLVIAALPVLLPLLGLSDRSSFSRPEISLYWLTGWAIWYSEFHRKDIYHLVFGAPLLVILTVYYLQRSRHRIAGVCLQLVMISAVGLALASLGLASVAHSTQTRVGSVSIFKPDPVEAQMELRIPVGQEILVYPSNPEYYFLSETRNPIRYGGLMYNYNSQAEFQNVVAILDQHKIKYVVWDTGYMAWNLKATFPSATPPTPEQLVVEPYLESHYLTVWEDGGVKIMERKAEVDAAK